MGGDDGGRGMRWKEEAAVFEAMYFFSLIQICCTIFWPNFVTVKDFYCVLEFIHYFTTY